MMAGSIFEAFWQRGRGGQYKSPFPA